MGHLGHVLVMCPILGHLYLSVYKNKGLKNSPGWVTHLYLTCTSIEVLEVHTGFVPHFEAHNSISHSYAWLKILQDGLQFSAPQVPHMGHLGHLLVNVPHFGALISLSQWKCSIKNSPGWVTLWQLTSSSFELLELLYWKAAHFELPIFLLNNTGHKNTKELYFQI